MLHLETVESDTFSLLESLLDLPVLQNYGLVGGSALSLLYGHRISVDLDLFSNQPTIGNEIITSLSKRFGKGFENRTTNPKFGVFGFINGIKVDIVNSLHPYLKPFNIVDGIRMFSTEDIVAMKVQAVFGRGKKKDFWDIAELLEDYSIDDFIQFHKEKYDSQNLLISVPQALTYFMDADESEEPISLKAQTWDSVKLEISMKVGAYLRNES